jgi:hypothetical protein
VPEQQINIVTFDQFIAKGSAYMRKKYFIEETLARKSQQSIRFNNKEMSAINNYCKKFKIKNRSKFMREAIITEVLRKFDKNYPTLWDEPQLRLF